MSYSLHTYRLASGADHIAILHTPDRKTKWLHVLVMRDRALGIDKVSASERDHMRALEHKGKPYPMARALKVFRKFAKSHGSSKAARDFIRAASPKRCQAEQLDTGQCISERGHGAQHIDDSGVQFS